MKHSEMKNLPSSEPIVKSLTYVRDDKYVILTTAREEESLHIVTEQRFLVGLPASLGMTNKLHEIPPYPFEMTENKIPRIRSKRLSTVILNISKTSST